MKRKQRIQIAPTVVVFAFLLSVPVFGGELPEAAKSLQSGAEKSLGGVRDQLLMDQMAAFGQYSNDLVSASAKCKSVGDLEGVLAIGIELGQLSKAVAIPDKDEPETPNVICRVRGSYRAAMVKAKEAYDQRQKAILERYVADLEAVKKKLTIEGKYDDAVIVRDLAAKAREPLARLSPVSERTEGAELPCAECSGTGKALESCPKCSGSGLCAMCGGEGLRKVALLGSADRMACVSCKKSGKCPSCKGTCKVPGKACDACRGTGKIRPAR